MSNGLTSLFPFLLLDSLFCSIIIFILVLVQILHFLPTHSTPTFMSIFLYMCKRKRSLLGLCEEMESLLHPSDITIGYILIQYKYFYIFLYFPFLPFSSYFFFLNTIDPFLFIFFKIILVVLKI